MTERGEESAGEKELPPAVPTGEDWSDDGEDLDLGQETQSDCRCGECCKLIIEVDLADARREPKIAERGSPIYLPPEVTDSGQRELAGYSLNDKANGYACTFLDRGSNLCSIYDTRPWVCRVFDCDGEQREELVQLGILPPRGRSR